MDHAQDLQFAQTANRAVNIVMLGGHSIDYVGVRSVEPENNTLTVWQPQTFQDASWARLNLSDILMVTVTDVEYTPPE